MDVACIKQKQSDGDDDEIVEFSNLDYIDQDNLVDFPDLVVIKKLIFKPAITSPTKIVSTCSKCKKEFSSAENLKIHDIIHTNEKYCPLCKREFNRRCEFVLHAKMHLKLPEPHQCKFCSKTFQTIRDLRDHSSVHVNERPHKCTTCTNKSFKKLSMLRRHMKKHADERNKKFACLICNVFFMTITSLRRHFKRIHDQQNKPIAPIVRVPDLARVKNINEPATTSPINIVKTCSKCLEEFSNASDLEIHDIIHTSDKYCPLCKKAFKRRYDFLNHVKTHLRYKLNKCRWCSKIFQTRKMLLDHINEHTNERPFKCTKCNKSYKHATMLQYHEDTHLPPKYRIIQSSVCPICKVSFKTRTNMRRHLRVTHKQHIEEMYNCELQTAASAADLGQGPEILAPPDDDEQMLEKSDYPEVCVKEEYEEIDIKIENLY